MATKTEMEGYGAADLVSRIRAGEPEAEEELFNRYRRGISVILRQQGESPDVADDLFQETITITLQKIRDEKVREPDSLSAFICRVAKNLAIAYFRKESPMFSATDISESICSQPDQYDQLLRKEEAAIVHRVIGELKVDRDRQILLRYYLGEEDRESICADLALNSLHFNRVLYRALQRFKELFEKQRKQ